MSACSLSTYWGLTEPPPPQEHVDYANNNNNSKGKKKSMLSIKESNYFQFLIHYLCNGDIAYGLILFSCTWCQLGDRWTYIAFSLDNLFQVLIVN